MKIIAVEIKYGLSPSKVEKDLAKLRDLIDKDLAWVVKFLALAPSDDKLMERLKNRGIFSKFGLKEEGKSDLGFVAWQTFEMPHVCNFDALSITLW